MGYRKSGSELDCEDIGLVARTKASAKRWTYAPSTTESPVQVETS